jgi:surface carbohydrate biosynthesis protein
MSKVFLAEEFSERERLTLLLLREALIARGHDAEIVPLKRLVRECQARRPDLIVSNAVTEVAAFVGNYLLLEKGTRIVNLHWEQVLNPHGFLRYRFTPAVAERLVDGRASWGSAFKRALVALNPGLDPSRVGVVGSIKHSEGQLLERLPRQELDALYGIERERYSAVVLCPTSFGLTSFSQPARDAVRFCSPFVDQLYQQHVRVKQEYLKALTVLATSHPEMLFVLRAHPTHARAYYASYKDVALPANLVLNAAGPISVAIAVSDLVLTSSSTVLMDAYVQNVPAINLRLENDAMKELGLVLQREDAFGHQIPFSSVPELRLEHYLGRQVRNRELDAMIEEWIGDHSPRAPDTLARFIEQTLEREPVSKRLRASDVDSPLVLRRAASHVSERLFHHRRFRPIGAASEQSFDYDRLFEKIKQARPRNVEQRSESMAV